jgi:hypothetical protein
MHFHSASKLFRGTLRPPHLEEVDKGAEEHDGHNDGGVDELSKRRRNRACNEKDQNQRI